MEMKPLLLAFMLAMFVLGISCLFFSRAVQSVAVKATGTGITSRSEALKAFLRSDRYLTSVRVVGLIALLAALFLAFAALKDGR